MNNGDLHIEGHDLGSGVGDVFGGGMREYEWVLTVRAAYLQRMISVLGGHEGDDVLLLLAARCAEDQRYASKSFLEEQGVPVEFWNRVGD